MAVHAWKEEEKKEEEATEWAVCVMVRYEFLKLFCSFFNSLS